MYQLIYVLIKMKSELALLNMLYVINQIGDIFKKSNTEIFEINRLIFINNFYQNELQINLQIKLKSFNCKYIPKLYNYPHILKLYSERIMHTLYIYFVTFIYFYRINSLQYANVIFLQTLIKITIIMIASNLKGLIPKSILSIDNFDRAFKKIDEYKTITQNILEYYYMVNKNFQTYQQFLLNQMKFFDPLIKSDLQKQQNSFFSEFPNILNTLCNNYNNFITRCENNLKQYHMNINQEFDMLLNEHYDLSYKKFANYRNNQIQLNQIYKNYIKNLKLTIETHKDLRSSSSEVKLAYSKSENTKRSKSFIESYKIMVKIQKQFKWCIEKTQNSKKQAIKVFNALVVQYQKLIKFVDQKIIFAAKNIFDIFSEVHQSLADQMNSLKEEFQTKEVVSFFKYKFICQNISAFFSNLNLSQEQQSNEDMPIFIKYIKSMKHDHIRIYFRWFQDYYRQLREKYEANRKIMKRIHTFFVELIRNIQRMFTNLMKQMPILLQKLKKKFTDLFGNKSFDYLKALNSSLEMSMRIHQKLIKSFNTRLENINKLIVYDQTISQNFFKEFNQHSNDLLFMYKNKQNSLVNEYLTKEIKQTLIMKSKQIENLILNYKPKVVQNLQIMKNQIRHMIKQFYNLSYQIYSYSEEYREIYFGTEFLEEGLNKCHLDITKVLDKDKNIFDIIPTIEIIQIEQHQKFKQDEFKITKSIQVQNQATTTINNDTIVQDQKSHSPKFIKNPEQQSISSSKCSEKQLKNYLFLTKRYNIIFQEGQTLLATFNCAYVVKILLQGKLFITNSRFFFHSYFNDYNVFFDNTFLQVPNNDVVKIEKKMNSLMFDNSISITTINGEMIFTSFRKRDQVLDLFLNQFLIKQSNKVKEQPIQQIQNNPVKNGAGQQQQSNGLVHIEELDNISQQQEKQREQKLAEVLSAQRTLTNTHIINNANCLQLLKYIFHEHPITQKGKKYDSFISYYKQCHLNQYDIEPEKWSPSIAQFLNSDNIKRNTPLNFKRKYIFKHPLKPVPFMPKFLTTTQNQSLYIISKNRFIYQSKVDNKGAPYVDYFSAYVRQEYTNAGKNVQVKFLLYFDFFKSTMMRNTIETTFIKEFKEGTILLTKIINNRMKIQIQKQLKTKQLNRIISSESKKYEINEQVKVEKQIKQIENNESNLANQLQSEKEKMNILRQKYEILQNSNNSLLFQRNILAIALVLIVGIVLIMNLCR